MIDPHDDLATSKPPYRVVACIAVLGRHELLKHTIERLYKKNGVHKVICAGDRPDDMQVCQAAGAIWTPRRNKPLGLKWNSAFEVARDYNPDAVLFVGSSDWLSDNWISIMRAYVDQHGFAGVPGCHLADFGEKVRLCHWKGYKGFRPERADESIGIGRMLSRRLMVALDWQPFDPIRDDSLDWSMKMRAKKHGYTDYMVHDHRLKALSLSTDLWPQKHKFHMHWDDLPEGGQRIPSEKIADPEQWLSQNFPEALLFHQTIKPLCELPKGTSVSQ